jgi:hypothetical protein
MKYMEVDLKRKKQMVQIAKDKYQKIIEVRHQSFIEKKSLKKVSLGLSRKDRTNPKSIS